MILDMTTEYACIFGKSSPIDGMVPGEHVTIIGQWENLYLVSGNGILFWYICTKLPKCYTYPDIPHFFPFDAHAICQRFLGVKITSHVDFRHIWERRTSYRMLPLEEGLHQKWHWKNIICIGDSIHKVCLTLIAQPCAGQSGQ